MNVTEQGWSTVPDFSERLQAAMDYAGLTARQVSERLGAIGINTRPQHVHRLLSGSAERRSNPTFVLIGGLATVCEVSAEWFFSNHDVTAEEQMVDRYGELASNG